MRRAKGIHQYRKVGIQTSISEASPHRLVQILFENAIVSLNQAKGAMDNKDLVAKGKAIGQAIKVIGMLRSSLNFEQGRELSERLAALYDHMMQQLVVANIKNSGEIIDECLSLIRTIKEGWDQIPEKLKEQQR